MKSYNAFPLEKLKAISVAPPSIAEKAV